MSGQILVFLQVVVDRRGINTISSKGVCKLTAYHLERWRDFDDSLRFLSVMLCICLLSCFSLETSVVCCTFTAQQWLFDLANLLALIYDGLFGWHPNWGKNAPNRNTSYYNFCIQWLYFYAYTQYERSYITFASLLKLYHRSVK